MKKKDHSIRNSVIATLIATLIIAIVKPLRDIALVFMNMILGVILALAKHLVTAASVPWWMIYAVIGVLLLLIWRTAKGVFKELATDATKQTHLVYTTDRFHGLVWRWLMRSNGQPYNIATFCPRCDMQLHPASNGYGYSTQFHCDKCEFTSKVIEMEPMTLEDWVIREIQRKLRTNEWKKGLQSQ